MPILFLCPGFHGVFPVIFHILIHGYERFFLLGQLIAGGAVLPIDPLFVDERGQLPDFPGQLHKAWSLPAALGKELLHEEAGGEVSALPHKVVA